MSPYADKKKNDECKRRWYHSHKAELSEKRKLRYKQIRNYYRRTRLGTSNGSIYRLNKREYPQDNMCEICNYEREKGLQYHHWDDGNYNKGIWICPRCHRFVEHIEKGYHHIYFKWKEMLDVEMKGNTIKNPIRNPKKSEIIRLVNEGRSNSEIAKELGVSMWYASQIRRIISDIPRWVKWSPQKVEFLLNNLGKIPIIQVANELGFKKVIIYNKIHDLKKQGVIKGDLRSCNGIQIIKPRLSEEAVT